MLHIFGFYKFKKLSSLEWLKKTFQDELIKNNGFILIDNVLWKGDVTDPSKNDRLTNVIREFNSFIKKDDRVEKTILPLGDGITICRKI